MDYHLLGIGDVLLSKGVFNAAVEDINELRARDGRKRERDREPRDDDDDAEQDGRTERINRVMTETQNKTPQLEIIQMANTFNSVTAISTMSRSKAVISTPKCR